MIDRRLAFAALPLALAACTTTGALPSERLGLARLSFANGLPAGTAQLFANGNDVSFAVAVTGVPRGEHGFHLHMTGRCEAPGFTSAGGHLNPGNNDHGKLDAGGSHLGDLPNIVVGPSLTATAQFDLPGRRDMLVAQIFDADGTAIVVHADPDDYRTDPSGNAGARIACGVLSRG